MDEMKQETKKEIKNVIFDCGKVLVYYDEHDISSHFATDPDDIHTLATVAMARKYWDRFDLGTLDKAGYLEELAAELPERLMPFAQEIYEGWVNVLIPVEGMDDLVREIKSAGKKVYLLSNFSHQLRSKLDGIPILYEFDGLEISGEVGLCKPDPAIYNHLIETFDLKPEECIFIDDREDNIEAGKGVGIDGYVFDGDVNTLRDYLISVGVL